MRKFLLASTSLALALPALLSLAHSKRAEASTTLRMDVPELVHHADLILEASVLSARPLEVDGMIATDYLLRVERTIEGEDEPFRTIRLPGGVLPDGRGMVLAGMPRILPGENLLLFLSAEGPTGLRLPVGLAQGKMTLRRQAHGTRFLVSDAGSALLLSRDGRLTQGEGRTARSYVDVLASIEATLAAERAQR